MKTGLRILMLIFTLLLSKESALAQCSGASIARTDRRLTVTPPMESYQWVYCSDYSPVEDGFNASYYLIKDGDYTVIVTKGSCKDTLSCVSVTGLGVGEQVRVQGLRIFPNPVGNTLTFYCAGFSSILTVCISDISGRTLVQQQVRADASGRVLLKLSVPSGTYFLRASDESGSLSTQRFAVE